MTNSGRSSRCSSETYLCTLESVKSLQVGSSQRFDSWIIGGPIAALFLPRNNSSNRSDEFHNEIGFRRPVVEFPATVRSRRPALFRDRWRSQQLLRRAPPLCQ